MTKTELFTRGMGRIQLWCHLNQAVMPRVETRHGKPDFGTCAYYRDGQIDIWVESCAGLGLAGRSWSWPGYVVDRTPYGVLAHELGHHVDKQHGPRGGDRSHRWRSVDPAPMTGYCPNDNEWFAELFRLFVTNPYLLEDTRPIVFKLMAAEWPRLVEARGWRSVLGDSERHVKAAANKVNAAERLTKRTAQATLAL